jgi:hypothetical protein
LLYLSLRILKVIVLCEVCLACFIYISDWQRLLHSTNSGQYIPTTVNMKAVCSSDTMSYHRRQSSPYNCIINIQIQPNYTGVYLQLGRLKLNHNPSVNKVIPFCLSEDLVQRDWQVFGGVRSGVQFWVKGFVSFPQRPDRLLKPPNLVFKRYWRFLSQG